MNQKDTTGLKSRVLSLIASHYGGVVISLIICLGLSTLMIGAPWQLLIAQLVAILAYAFPTYNAAWAMGHTDLNRANFGRIPRDKLYGFKLGAIISIPMYVMAILLILSRFDLFWNFTVIYRLLNAHTWPLLNLIHPTFEMESFGVISLILFAIVPSVATIAVTGIGYLFGNHDFSPMQKLVYKNSKKAKQELHK